MTQRPIGRERNNITRIHDHASRKKGRDNDRRPLIYLALAGGGVGALGFEVGGLCALERVLIPNARRGNNRISKLNDLLTGYQGVSAGAIVSTLLALGFSPHTIRDVMLEHSAAFPSLRRDVLGTQPTMYFSLAEQFSRGVMRSVISVINGLLRLDLPMIGWPSKNPKERLGFADMRMMARLIRFGAFEHASVNNVIHNVLDTLKGGLYSAQGIGEYIAEVIKDYSHFQDRFSTLTKELYLYAAELNSSQVRVFGTHGEHLPYELADAPISKCVEISCAIPVFFKPVYLEQTGKYYMDGGVIKSLHLQNLIDRINYVRPSQRVPAIILTFFPFVPPIFPSGSNYTNLSVLELLSLSLKMTYLEKFQTALRSYRHEEENNIHIQIFKPSRHSKTARTHPLQDISPSQIAQLNYEGEVAVYRAFLNDYDRLEKIFHSAGIEIAPHEEIAVLLKACRSYYGLAGSSEEASPEMQAPEVLPKKGSGIRGRGSGKI
jgi:predicted acylesterase/phospholipase RssA